MKKKRIVSLLLVAVLLLTACGRKKNVETTIPETEATMETTAPAATVPETVATTPEAITLPAPAEDHIIETPYGNLCFPGDWAPFLKTEITENPYTVAFFAVLDNREAPQKLFAISFGGKAENAAAAVKTAEGYAAVSVIYESFEPDASWSDGEVNIVYSMQEALNAVLENLPLEDADVLLPNKIPGGISGTDNQVSQEQLQKEQPEAAKPGDAELPESMKEDLAIDTPYMELHYPSKWADNLSIQLNEENAFAVGYYCSIDGHEDMQLFTVYFGGQQGVPLKTIKTEAGEMVEIRIEVPELSLDDSWAEDEKSVAFAMQEDLNYLISKMY